MPCTRNVIAVYWFRIYRLLSEKHNQNGRMEEGKRDPVEKALALLFSYPSKKAISYMSDEIKFICIVLIRVRFRRNTRTGIVW